MRNYMVENGYPDFLEHLRYMIATATPGMLVNVVVDLSHWETNVDFKLAKKMGYWELFIKPHRA